MINQNIVGQPAAASNNAILNSRSGQLGDAIVSELHGRYYETTYRSNSFLLSVSTAAAVTAFSGGAAGTVSVNVSSDPRAGGPGGGGSGGSGGSGGPVSSGAGASNGAAGEIGRSISSNDDPTSLF